MGLFVTKYAGLNYFASTFYVFLVNLTGDSDLFILFLVRATNFLLAVSVGLDDHIVCCSEIYSSTIFIL